MLGRIQLIIIKYGGLNAPIPQRCPYLILRTMFITLPDKRDSTDVIKLRLLRWEIVTKCPYKREAGGDLTTKEGSVVREERRYPATDKVGGREGPCAEACGWP